jgi:hypothetical protein
MKGDLDMRSSRVALLCIVAAMAAFAFGASVFAEDAVVLDGAVCWFNRLLVNTVSSCMTLIQDNHGPL